MPAELHVRAFRTGSICAAFVAVLVLTAMPALGEEDDDPYSVYSDVTETASDDPCHCQCPEPASAPTCSRCAAELEAAERSRENIRKNRLPIPAVETRLVFDNDIFILNSTGGDRGYTNGMRLAFVWPLPVGPGSTIARWRNAHENPVKSWFFERFDVEGTPARPRIGIAAGQEIYTPKDLKIRSIISDDRPYAGWLYLAFLFEMAGPRAAMQFEVQVGGTGEWSGAKETQRFIHQNLASGSKYPRGWGHQIATGVAANVNLNLSHHLFNVQSPRDWGVPVQFLDSLIFSRTRVGTFITSQALGGLIRMGEIKKEWPVERAAGEIVPDRKIPERFRAGGADMFQVYVYGRLQSEFVLRNSTLQGLPYMTSPHTTHIQPLVHEGEVGVVFQPINLFDIAFAATHRTQETRSGLFDPGGHTWGSFRLNLYWY